MRARWSLPACPYLSRPLLLFAHALVLGVGFVLRSLTPNHRDILKLLAEHQSDASSGGGSSGVGFSDFSSMCQEHMLVSNASALRHHMTELKDHALVTERRNADGREVLLVPEDKLQAILAQLVEGSGKD